MLFTVMHMFIHDYSYTLALLLLLSSCTLSCKYNYVTIMCVLTMYVAMNVWMHAYIMHNMHSCMHMYTSSRGPALHILRIATS